MSITKRRRFEVRIQLIINLGLSITGHIDVDIDQYQAPADGRREDYICRFKVYGQFSFQQPDFRKSTIPRWKRGRDAIASWQTFVVSISPSSRPNCRRWREQLASLLSIPETGRIFSNLVKLQEFEAFPLVFRCRVLISLLLSCRPMAEQSWST